MIDSMREISSRPSRYTSLIRAEATAVASARMSDVYRDGLELISRIESIIKR
jgi:hypothetical protein